GFAAGQDEVLDRAPVARRVLGLEQGRKAGDMRGRHRGAVGAGVVVEIYGAEDVHARRTDVHRSPAEVGEGRQQVVVVGGCNRDHVGNVEVGRVEIRSVVVDAEVPGGGDKQDAGVTVRPDGIEHGLRKSAQCAVTVVGGDDVDAAVELQVEQVVEADDRIGDRTVAGRIQELAGSDLHVPVDADHAQTVVADRA